MDATSPITAPPAHGDIVLASKPRMYMRGSVLRTIISTLAFPFIIIGIILIGVLSSCSTQTRVGGPNHAPIVRVKLLQSIDGTMLTGSGETSVLVAGETQPHRLHFPVGTPVLVTRGRDGWHIGNVVLGGSNGALGELTLQPEHDGDIAVGGKTYRGKYRLVPNNAPAPVTPSAVIAISLTSGGNTVEPNRFDVVNDVDVDSYLKSVITGEMPARFGDEAYKAQAIVARTYALYEAKTVGAGRDFDVYSDTRSQVYAGMAAETPRSRTAAEETGGIVVAAGPTGQERIFKAYFSACCGGIGQSAADAFGDPPTRELTEVKVGSLCNESPRYNWSPIELSKEELTRRIRSWGTKRDRPEKTMATLTRIDIAAYNQFGRPVRFMLTDAIGRRYSLSGEETRWACNSDANKGPTLLSSFFNPINGPDSVRFSDGHGSGHGVGLCQWCAEARSEKGMRHEDIVILSYPGSKLVRAY